MAKETKKGKKEKRKPCVQCAKSLVRIKWYYRNGNYFCSKHCFREFLKKQKTK